MSSTTMTTTTTTTSTMTTATGTMLTTTSSPTPTSMLSSSSTTSVQMEDQDQKQNQKGMNPPPSALSALSSSIDSSSPSSATIKTNVSNGSRTPTAVPLHHRNKQRQKFPLPPPGFPLPPPPGSTMMMMSEMEGSTGTATTNGPSPTTYHPEFMFCGSCTDCQDTTTTTTTLPPPQPLSPKLSKPRRSSSTTIPPPQQKLQQTTLQLRNEYTSIGDEEDRGFVIMIQSLLQPLPGVQNVSIKMVPDPNSGSSPTTTSPTVRKIVIDHDASSHTQQFITALESAGHPVIELMNPHDIQRQQRLEKTSSSHSYSNSHSYHDDDKDYNEREVNEFEEDQNENEEIWVRSQFHVQGVCCTSELPALRHILHIRNIGPGVGKHTVNFTTKVVHVQHNIQLLDAQQIANELTYQGFPTQIKKDGGKSLPVVTGSLGSGGGNTQQIQTGNDTTSSSPYTTVGRSTLHIEGGLTNQNEVSQIQRLLANVDGVMKIGVNMSEGVVYVDHDTSIVSSTTLADRLSTNNNISTIDDNDNNATRSSSSSFRGFRCTVAIGAERAAGDATATALDQIGRSRYVESTIQLEGIQPYQVPLIEKVLKRNFIRAQVRAVYPSVLSETMKVEHDPKLVSIDDVCIVLNDPIHNTSYGSALTASIAVDGAHAKLYLPLQEDYPENQVSYETEPSLMTIHANVWLSGVFWILSLVSYMEGWEWFKYFGLLSVLFGLPPIARKAWRTVRRRQFDANCMMVTASIGALALGEFDEAASVAFLFAISEFLEARATIKARRALSEICALRPDHANVIHPITKEIIVVPADRVPLGSLISVKTGDKIAADGIIVEGSSAVDESSLTGEATPAHKRIGDEVSGGTINIGQTQLVIKTTTTVEDSAVSRLIRLVEEAQSNRSPTEKMIDVFARSYTPGVMCMAILMCTVPWVFGSEVGRYWTLNGLIVIVIACPCALTISTPVTYAAGLAATAQQGIVIKGGAKLEAMGSVDRVVFDKTGTLTKGDFSVTHLEVVGSSKTRTEMFQLLSLMQERASHPIASSLVQAAKEEGVNIPRHVDVSDHQILKGEGITACVDSETVYVGNERLFDRLKMLPALSTDQRELVREWGQTGGTVGFIGTSDNGIIGIFCVKDVVRDDARAIVDELKQARIDALICTGDSDAAAQAVAKEIGIPSGAVNSQLLPEDKLHFVGSLKRPQPRTCSSCREKRYVLFVGDGVNDAPALAVADVGVSMGEGSAMALEMSDVTLMDSRLTKLVFAIKMGQRVLRTVKENILISLFAKVAVVVLTFAGMMTLLYAIAADVGIMLLVTLNGMKLLPNTPSSSTFFAGFTSTIRGFALERPTTRKYKNDEFELVGSWKRQSSELEDDPTSFLKAAEIV